MTVYLFGQDLTVNFYPLKDNKKLTQADFATVTMQDSYLFAYNARPTKAAAAAGTGALVTLTAASWSANSAYGFSYSLDAINDPDQASSIYRRVYYLAVNFKLDSSEQTQTVIEPMIFMRSSAELESITVSAEDLKQRFPKLGSYISDAELNDIIEDAIVELKLDLQGQEMPYKGIVQPDALEQAVAYKAIELASDTLIRDTDDRHDKRRERYEQKYKNALKLVPIDIDTDEDGEPDVANANASRSYRIIL